jgi:hypothetical protein
MIKPNVVAQLQRKAQQKQKQLARLRRDPRYLKALGAFLRARLITTNDAGVQPVKGPVELKAVLWAGRVEPRLLELLPAVMLKKPAMIEYKTLPLDLARVLDQLRRNETPEDFRRRIASLD